MNNARRKQLATIAERIESLKAQLDEIAADIETAKDEEQEAFDGLPESLQGADKGQAMETAIGELDEAYSGMGDIASTLDSVIDNLNNAAN